MPEATPMCLEENEDWQQTFVFLQMVQNIL